MKDHRLRSRCILLNSLSRGHSVRRMGIWCPMAVIQQESIAFPSHGREFQPQAALLHQFPPYLAQRQPCSFSSSQANRMALGAFAFCALSVLWFQLDLNQRWSQMQLWSCCLKSILLCHLPLLFRGKGVGESHSQAG